ncbi:MAG: hypothetical protein F6K30_13960 [Cyanothece sp. SIO2G6]|nr:hypothetical protein [Cyanothece sp. SIO2G6]
MRSPIHLIIMQLPNPDKAIVDERKLVGYCLNPNHSDGYRVGDRTW